MVDADRWLDPARFEELQRRLVRHLGSRYGARLGVDDREELANAAAFSLWQRLQTERDVRDLEAYAVRIADNLARRMILRDRHHRTSGPPLDTPEGRWAAETATLEREETSVVGQAIMRERSRQGLALLGELRRIRRRDTDIFIAQMVQGHRSVEVCERLGITEAQRRKAISRVGRWISCATDLTERSGLTEPEVVALAHHCAGSATPRQSALVEGVLERPDGWRIFAQVADALRHGAYMPPVLAGADEAASRGRAGRLADVIAATREQLASLLSGGKQTIVTTTSQYGPLAPGVRPGAAIGAALAVCIGSAAVCVDQGVISNPFTNKRPPSSQYVKAPRALRGRLKPAKPVAARPVPSPSPVEQSVRLRAAAPTPPSGAPTTRAPSSAPAGGGGGGGQEFGGDSSEFGGGPATPGGGGNEFGGGSSGGGSSSGGGGGGGGGEFGLP